MLERQRAELVNFIAAQDYAVVSYLSREGFPQSAVVGIAVTPDLEIVFDTVASSRKHQSLKLHPQCAIALWKDEITVQFEGVAEESSSEDFKEVYFEKFPDGRDRQRWTGITYFAVRPKWIRYSDFKAKPPRIEEIAF